MKKLFLVFYRLPANVPLLVYIKNFNFLYIFVFTKEILNNETEFFHLPLCYHFSFLSKFLETNTEFVILE